MSARSRSRGGKFSKPSNENTKADQKNYFAKPLPRIDTTIQITPPFQEQHQSNGALRISKMQRKDPKDIEKAARRVYSYALACSWVISTLMMITKGIFFILSVLLSRSATQDDGVMLIITTMGRCIRDDDEGTCLSKFREGFFSSRKTAEKYWLSCYFSESNGKGLIPISQLQFPLFSDNPILLIISLVFTMIVYWILCSVYDLLIDITTIAAPQLSSRRT